MSAVIYRLGATNRNRPVTKTSLKTIAAAALLSTLVISPVFAQAAISEPGAFSFYHPDRDVLNGGKPLSEEAAPYSARDAYAATQDSIVRHHVRRHRASHAAY
jgi:hypothetical protein